MFRLLGLVVSIGLVDSINPSTVAPALYLATSEHPRREVGEFTLSVFVVYLAGGALLTLGPGQIIRSAIPDLDVQQTIRHVGELVAGVILLVAAAMLWRRSDRLTRRGLPQPKAGGRSSALLGASITAVELPTAFPYFAAIAAILASGRGPLPELVLLLIFNFCFVLPLIGILAVLTFARDSSGRILGRCRHYLERRWPRVLSVLILLVGVAALVFGATGLAAQSHSRVGRFFNHIRRKFHLHP